MASCLVVQHVEPESSYAVGEALAAVGIEIVLCRTYEDERLPRHIGDFDGLVVMGGPMSAISDAGFSTRRQEMKLLAEAIELEMPTLGICLGAQLLASAAGGRVIASSAGPEIGWAPIRFSTDATSSDPLFASSPVELTVLHWHGETYELPPGAVHLASSSANHQQAFRVGTCAWGLQFHLEINEAAIGNFLIAFADEALAAGTTPEAIGAETRRALRALLPYRREVLARFADLVARGTRSLSAPRKDQVELA